MSDIPPDLFSRLYKVLSNCGPFANDGALRAVFSDARISLWRNKLPQANNPDERIKITLDFLRMRYSTTQENALVLFLRVLSEQTDPGDACHRDLCELATELEQRLSVPQLEDITVEGRETRETYPRILAWIRRHGWKYALVGGSIVLIIGYIILNMRSSPTSEQPVTLTLSPQVLTTPTSTLTPDPTDTPIVTPIPAKLLATDTSTVTPTPVKLLERDYSVSIAKFDQVSDNPIEISRRLERDLRAKLDEYELTNEVDVQFWPEVITSELDARDYMATSNTDVVIWGWYDDTGIDLNVLVREITRTSIAQVADLDEVHFGAAGSSDSVSFVVADTLPSNTSFVSLFVIGQLYYLSNNHADGYQAFNAAMDNIPPTVALDNEALLHLFNARSLHETGSTDLPKIACEYISAIQLDSELFVAYNNLALLLLENAGHLSSSDIEQVCELSPGFDLSPRALLNQALDVYPGGNWALAMSNLAILDWREAIEYYNTNEEPISVVIERFSESFENILKLDPTIVGAHIMLGNLAIWKEDFLTGVTHYTTAAELWPHSAETYVNLGQAYALSGDKEKAEQQYRQALALASEDSAAYAEAHLALGNLYQRDGEPTKAYQEYQSVPLCENATYCTGLPGFNDTLRLALAKYEIDQGNWENAISHVVSTTHSCTDTNCYYYGGAKYILWLLYNIYADMIPDYHVPYTLTWQNEDIASAYIAGFSDWTDGDVADMAWVDIIEVCGVPEINWQPFDITIWGSEENPCLPNTLEERVEVFYQHFYQRVHHRLFFNRGATIGGRGACPYVFTYDQQSQDWLVDTTIIYKLIGPADERLQARPLTRFDGRLWLRELEPETSYVNFLYVRILTSEGRWLTLRPLNTALLADDDQYLILNEGEHQLVEFELPITAMPVQKAWVVTKGYYLPYSEGSSP